MPVFNEDMVALTRANTFSRQEIFINEHSQVVLMNVEPRGDVGGRRTMWHPPSTTKRSTERRDKLRKRGLTLPWPTPGGAPDMNPFEQMQSLAELWGKSGKAFATAQQGLFSGMTDMMAKAVGAGDHASFQAFTPDTQGFEAARQDFAKLWSSA